MIRVLMVCLLLAGCAGAPQVVEKPVEVRVPVPVLCRAPEIPEPDWPLAKVPATASDFEFYRAALAELALRAGYEIRLKEAVATCQRPGANFGLCQPNGSEQSRTAAGSCSVLKIEGNAKVAETLRATVSR